MKIDVIKSNIINVENKIIKIINLYDLLLDNDLESYYNMKDILDNKIKNLKFYLQNIESIHKRILKDYKTKCIKKTTPKYLNRKSPPYSAVSCIGQTKFGNDGNKYISVKKREGIYTWKKLKTANSIKKELTNLKAPSSKIIITEKDLTLLYYKEHVGNNSNNSVINLPDWNNLDSEERIEWTNKVIKAKNIKVQNGYPLYWLYSNGYRNEELMFWSDKNGVIFPYTDIDDYGSVPPIFRVGNADDEFAPDYWIDDVDHNSLIFLSKKLVKEIKENVKPVIEYDSYTKQKFETLECKIEIKGKTYNVEIYGKEKDSGEIKDYFNYEKGKLIQSLYDDDFY